MLDHDNGSGSTILKNGEPLVTIPQIAKAVPPSGVSPATAWRWVLNGLSDGRRLESIKIGGRTYSSAGALNRFLRPRGDAQSHCESSKARERQIAAAEAELDAIL